ncbi:MAG: glycosyltransferase [Bacteroidota bacterium]
MSVLEQTVDGLELLGMCYMSSYVLVYFILGILSSLALRRYYRSKYFLQNQVLVKSNQAVGVSIVAPAYNEAATIVQNVKSLLSQEYPKFEVVIINDGSTDGTLETLVTEFSLVRVNFFYQERVETQPVRGHYRSTDPVYSKLLVVDKENGGSKADGSNAGINSAKYDFFICTDVDCILRKDTISTLVKPFIENTEKVIATGGMIRISNACEFKDGMLRQSHFPSNFFARFQELEYTRAFVFGRMAWTHINSLLLVSGGLGMFHKETAIAAGGYWHKSMGEDMDLIIRMRQLMHKRKEHFLIKYVPETLCWTEVPSTMTIFLRQRTRWGRGLIQTINRHKKILFRPKYGRTGFIGFPYFVFFEFLVPIMELLGLLVLAVNLIYFGMGVGHMLIILLTVYLFYGSVTLLSVLVDQIFYKHYASVREMGSLIFTALVEPFVYHPLNVFAFLRGYVHFLINREQKWGVMNRKGFDNLAES